MALDSAINTGANTAGKANVDSTYNLNVNLPVVQAQAGFVQDTYVRDATTARAMRVTEEGEAYSATGRLMFFADFNNATATPMSAMFNGQNTTMLAAATAGFLRLNSGVITTINTGYAFETWRQFSIEGGSAMRVKTKLRTVQGASSNKQIDVGLGFYSPAAGQAAAMNEFCGFRWTTAGALQGVLEYSVGGAPTSLTVSLNGGVPYSDNVTREYEIVVTDNRIEFWVNNAYLAEIVFPADGPGTFKASGYPFICRLFNAGSAPAIAPVLDIGDITVTKIGPEADLPLPYRQALMGRHCIYNQPGITVTDGQTALVPASGTLPTAATGSNVATTFTGLGGFFRENGAAITVTPHTNIIVSSYQNPAFPVAAGAANDARNLVITDLFISPLVVTTVLVGGGAVLEWFVAIGGSALSLATATALGSTTPGSKAPRIIPLPIVDSFAAAAAAGVVLTRSGASNINFSTPLVVNPGEFVVVGFRILQVTAAVTSGTIDGGIGFGGYWD